MRSIIKFFLVNSVAANLLMVFIFIMGIVGLLNMKTTFFPEAPNKIINIQMIFPGASPEEMEEGVTSKIEENLIGVKGIDKTTSVSSENSANIVVEAKEGVNMDELLQDVKNAVDRISSFPTAMEPPVIFKAEQTTDAYKFAISGDLDLKVLKKFAQDIEDDLLAIDGISKMELIGFPEEEIEISFREKDMRALDIAFNEAVSAIAQTNLLATGGTIETETEDLLIRAKNKNYYAAEFRDIVVRSNPNGGVIRLAQIADIKDRWEDTPTRNYVNGVPGVSINVFNTLEEDMYTVSDLTQEYLADFKIKHPEVTVTEIRDGKLYLNGRIQFIKENGAVGFLIVFVLLAMFLNIRLAFWVALAIPISFAGMFMAASLLGVTINVISTFGMVVVIGILVDDGIVIAENIYQHYERGANPMDAALEGTMEVLPAVTSAIITTVIAFSMFFFIEGRLGDIFPQMAVVVIFTLVFSLVEGAFILPAHIAHSKALKEGNVNPITTYFDRVMDFLRKRMYGPVLNFSMRFPLPTITICITGLLVVLGAFSGGFIKGTFFPFVQRDNFSLSLELPAGANEARVEAILDSIEMVSWQVNEQMKNEYFGGEKNVIEKIVKTIGPASYKGNLNYYLLSGEERPDVKNRMIINAIRQQLGPVDEADKLVFGLGGTFGIPVSISLIGKNKEEINNAITDLKEELSKITDLRDIQDNNVEGLKEVAVALKPKAYNLGLTLGQIMQYVRQGFFGAEIQRLQRGSDEVKVWIRYGEEDRSSLEDLAKMRYRSTNGQSIPLGDLVTFSTARGVVNINHLNGQREIRVTADVANEQVSVSDINNDINIEILPRVLAKYPSVKVSFEGQAKENKKGQDSMTRVMPMVAICMLFVIILTFGSVSQAFIVFALFPFGFIGVGLGHWLMGLPISFLSVLGMIALIGILVNDALVFISTFNGKIREGHAFKPALYDTGISRFRPILLTTVTTVAGLLPLLLEKSVQAQFLIPMAISIAFGLMVSTFILLVLIPALLVIASDIRLFSTKLWTGDTELTRAMVEPSFAEREHPWVLTLVFALLALVGIGALVRIALVIAGTVL